MRSTFQNLVLAATATLVIAFVVSFALGMRQPATPAMAADPPRIVPGISSGKRVEILNASGKTGQARGATEILRSSGYDVVYFGNASRAGDSMSAVWDRVGKPEVARAIADRLNIGRVETRLDSTRLVEVSVVLGRDWTGARAGGGRR